jgi:hypothetical protein
MSGFKVTGIIPDKRMIDILITVGLNLPPRFQWSNAQKREAYLYAAELLLCGWEPGA